LILKDFGQCPSMHYFDGSSEEDDIWFLKKF
jgi:hypothetical protein